MKKQVLVAIIGAFAVSVSNGQTQWPEEEECWDHYDSCSYIDARSSPLAIPDGSGVATNGVINREVIRNTAFIEPYAAAEEYEMVPEASEATTTQTTSGMDIHIGHGRFTVGDTDGESSAMGVPYNRKWNDRLTLKTSLNFNYTVLKDADFATIPPRNVKIMGTGLTVSPSYGVYNALDKREYRWFVTPTFGFMLREANRVNVGTVTYTGGVASNYYRKVGDRVILNVGNAFTTFYSSKSKGRYADLSRRSQQIIINGVQLIYPHERWVFSVMAIDNRYLRNSHVDAWQTYGFSAGYRLGKGVSARIYAETDQGTDYQGWSVGISSAWRF